MLCAPAWQHHGTCRINNSLDTHSLILYITHMRKDKARDIARGVLPSTARKGARDDKRNFHAKHRHAQRQANHAIERSLATIAEDGVLVHDPDLYDDFEDREIFDGYHAATKDEGLGWDDMSQHGEIISHRRGADKLGPLISWATATEKNKMVGWSDEDKIGYFKAILPDNLQGRHALGHVKSALRLEPDPFYFGWRNYTEPATLEQFRAALSRHLATPKSRLSLHDFILETVPVAAHTTTTNNKVLTRVHAVDEEGNLRYLPPHLFPGASGYLPRRPYMVDAYVPQTVATTCDDCSFLRNDPLTSTAAVNRFVDIVWDGLPVYSNTNYYLRRKGSKAKVHPFLEKIREHVLAR